MKDAEITPEHTAARIEQILAELESLRLEMGRARDNRAPMQVRDAQPREVFYHAVTVHRKANQLAVELGADSVAPPSAKVRALADSADVLHVLDGVMERLAKARSLLNLEGDAPRSEAPGALTSEVGSVASDTLYRCLIASRQLDAMLQQAFDSREGHAMLLRALGLMSVLLRKLGSELPADPPHERRKSPRDNFQVLWETCLVLYKALTESGVKLVEIQRGFVGEEPTDVYDLSSLIVSELEYVASVLNLGEAPPLAVPMPKPILPAHNHRRARHLQIASNNFARLVRANPNWLKP